jgi:hypothetical protein
MSQKVFGAFGSLLLSAVVSAQALNVPANVNSGQAITIGYSNSARPGETVMIRVCIYNPEPCVIEVPVTLGSDGSGSTSWTVPAGFAVTFNAPSVKEVARAMQ